MLFSTAPGRVALDGPAGEYSPFAAAFLRQLAAGTTDLQLLADKLRRDLLLATQGRQLVYAINSYDHPFRVDGPRDPAAELSGTGLGSVQPVELPRAYVFAKESGFELPTGLVAIRSAANTSDSRKVGAFSCTERYPMGPRPGLLVVLAIDESMTAQILLAGKTDRGAYWRFVTGKVSGERLEFYHRAAGARTLFDWHDGDSGSMSQVWEAVQGPKPYVAKFTRLDG